MHSTEFIYSLQLLPPPPPPNGDEDEESAGEESAGEKSEGEESAGEESAGEDSTPPNSYIACSCCTPATTKTPPDDPMSRIQSDIEHVLQPRLYFSVILQIPTIVTSPPRPNISSQTPITEDADGRHWGHCWVSRSKTSTFSSGVCPLRPPMM